MDDELFLDLPPTQWQGVWNPLRHTMIAYYDWMWDESERELFDPIRELLNEDGMVEVFPLDSDEINIWCYENLSDSLKFVIQYVGGRKHERAYFHSYNDWLLFKMRWL